MNGKSVGDFNCPFLRSGLILKKFLFGYKVQNSPLMIIGRQG